MKKVIKIILLVTLLCGLNVSAWGQAIPSTEGTDFWVTFLRADADAPTRLKLTISAREACDVKIENPNNGFSQTQKVGDNSCTELEMAHSNCYSSQSETPTYTALHVTSTKEISLFAGNYRNKSFDAANILPTAALLDDYLIQTYPASDHEDNPQGSHFAIVAVEEGETVVDYNLTAKTKGGKTGAQTVTLKQGQVFYVWTGNTEGDASDLSGTSVKARNEKKIAVFQGCPHTNVPDKVRNRDHIFSQAMPTAYWGTEFGITASLLRRRDIIAVMAINDGTEVYINAKDGEKRLVHTFDFSEDTKHYWTFEIGDEIAYCNSKESPYHGQLLETPLVIDSSCYLTTSCPTGVHLIMASNRYDLPDLSAPEPDSDPALLWISPIEQVIKEINFATYNEGINTHYVNIVTSTSNVLEMTLDDNGISQHFRKIRGSEDYSYARIPVQPGNHKLKGYAGFLAHVYGYGEKASYAYSCGSSTVARSVSFNDIPVLIDSISPRKFCVGDEIDMKLNIGNNEYETIEWDYGDGVIYSPSEFSTNEEKKKASHTYNSPGWYDLRVSAVYVNSCTQMRHNETMKISFQVVSPDTIVGGVDHRCIHKGNTLDDGTVLSDAEVKQLLKSGGVKYEPGDNCYDPVKAMYFNYGLDSEYEFSEVGKDSAFINGKWYYESQDIKWNRDNASGCDSAITCHLKIVTCLSMDIPNDSSAQHICYGEALTIPFKYIKGEIGKATVTLNGKTEDIDPDEDLIVLPTISLNPGTYKASISVSDPICEQTLEFPLDIAIYYPDSIFKFKFNNVLAVYKAGFGGNKGWAFDAYQWYKDNVAIEGANESLYHTEGDLPKGSYYVELTDKKGMKIRSCAQDIDPATKTTQTNAAPAQKVMRDNQIYIMVGETLYDIYGQRVQ